MLEEPFKTLYDSLKELLPEKYYHVYYEEDCSEAIYIDGIDEIFSGAYLEDIQKLIPKKLLYYFVNYKERIVTLKICF